MNCCDLNTLIKNSPAGPLFRGVVTPGSGRKLGNGFWVVFLNPRRLSVGHYAGLYVKNEKAWFFNSLGDANGFPLVERMLKHFITVYNVRQLQSELTQVCALYVLYFFIKMSEGLAFDQFLDEFPRDALVNDLYVTAKTLSYYKRYVE